MKEIIVTFGNRRLAFDDAFSALKRGEIAHGDIVRIFDSEKKSKYHKVLGAMCEFEACTTPWPSFLFIRETPLSIQATITQ